MKCGSASSRADRLGLLGAPPLPASRRQLGERAAAPQSGCFSEGERSGKSCGGVVAFHGRLPVARGLCRHVTSTAGRFSRSSAGLKIPPVSGNRPDLLSVRT